MAASTATADDADPIVQNAIATSLKLMSQPRSASAKRKMILQDEEVSTSGDDDLILQSSIVASLQPVPKRPQRASKSVNECGRESSNDACCVDDQVWHRCQCYQCSKILCTKHYKVHGFCSENCEKSSKGTTSNAAADFLPAVHNITKNCIALHNSIW